MALNNYSFQFGSFVFGGAGSPYQITAITGLESLPAIRNQDDTRGYNDGMFSGRDFLSGRTIILNVLTLAGNGNTAFQNYNLFQAALQPQTSGTTVLQFQLSSADVPVSVGARVRANATVINPEYTFGYIQSQVTLFCPDPRYYGAAQTLSMTASSALGRTYNRVYNLLYGGGSQTGSVLVANTGWATTYPKVTINGPITNPTISNNTTGQFITCNITLGVSDSLVVDLLNKTVTLNGSSARNLMAGNSQWFGCPPGSTTVSLAGTFTTAGVTSASLVYSPAFV